MATATDYIEFVMESLGRIGTENARYKKMFGEYMVYIDERPVLLVCDNTVFVKKLPEISEMMKHCDVGFPFDGAKEHYILDIEDTELTEKLIPILRETAPLPKKRNKKS